MPTPASEVCELCSPLDATCQVQGRLAEVMGPADGLELMMSGSPCCLHMLRGHVEESYEAWDFQRSFRGSARPAAAVEPATSASMRAAQPQ